MDAILLDVPGTDRRTIVRLGPGALGTVPEEVAGVDLVLLVTDENLARTQWPERVAVDVEATGARLARTVLPAGEDAKGLSAVRRLWSDWLAAGAGRDALVVAVGGGVVTDVAGFAAATFLRGVPWVAVPTTVLAMADAAIGGKTGVNLPEGKNLAGALHHPRAVVADPATLATLDADTHRDGFAEVVKAGVIGDLALLERLEEKAASVVARDEDVVAELLAASVAVKVAVVAADAEEASRREILNFGHAAAHAIEGASDHAISHGCAVSLGMIAEARLGVAEGRLERVLVPRLEALLTALGLPTRVDPALLGGREALAAFLGRDKKRREGCLRIALPSALGRHGAAPSVEIDPDDLLDEIERLAPSR